MLSMLHGTTMNVMKSSEDTVNSLPYRYVGNIAAGLMTIIHQLSY